MWRPIAEFDNREKLEMSTRLGSRALRLNGASVRAHTNAKESNAWGRGQTPALSVTGTAMRRRGGGAATRHRACPPGFGHQASPARPAPTPASTTMPIQCRRQSNDTRPTPRAASSAARPNPRGCDHEPAEERISSPCGSYAVSTRSGQWHNADLKRGRSLT